MPDQDKTPKSSETDAGFGLGRSTRRTFISRLGMAGVFASAARITPSLAQQSETVKASASESNDAIPVTLRVNGGNPMCGSTRARRYSTVCASICSSPDQRKDAIMASAVLARSTLTAGASFRVSPSLRCTKPTRSRRSKASVSRRRCIRCKRHL